MSLWLFSVGTLNNATSRHHKNTNKLSQFFNLFVPQRCHQERARKRRPRQGAGRARSLFHTNPGIHAAGLAAGHRSRPFQNCLPSAARAFAITNSGKRACGGCGGRRRQEKRKGRIMTWRWRELLQVRNQGSGIGTAPVGRRRCIGGRNN